MTEISKSVDGVIITAKYQCAAFTDRWMETD